MLPCSDIVHLPGGPWRFRVYVDGGISPNGVGWEKKLPANVSDREISAAKQQMEEHLRVFIDK